MLLFSIHSRKRKKYASYNNFKCSLLYKNNLCQIHDNINVRANIKAETKENKFILLVFNIHIGEFIKTYLILKRNFWKKCNKIS